MSIVVSLCHSLCVHRSAIKASSSCAIRVSLLHEDVAILSRSHGNPEIPCDIENLIYRDARAKDFKTPLMKLFTTCVATSTRCCPKPGGQSSVRIMLITNSRLCLALLFLCRSSACIYVEHEVFKHTRHSALKIGARPQFCARPMLF